MGGVGVIPQIPQPKVALPFSPSTAVPDYAWPFLYQPQPALFGIFHVQTFLSSHLANRCTLLSP